ncbi:aldehyde dehydrogenase family domain-containing protein [Ditylenchus destructor]|nr:aldehyde dehydrogenase family domain-containing protein [Ditylenchus destructor]
MVSQYGELLTKQRKYFRTGATRPLEFRKAQLRKLREVIEQHQDDIMEAVYKDLRRHKEVSRRIEVFSSFTEIDNVLAHLDEWAKPVEIENKPAGKPSLIKEPKGVVLIMTAWNVPFVVGFLPLISAIASGNTAVIKPSEVSAHSAKVLEKIIQIVFEEQYVAVVQGGVNETTELLKERFDHICYTGSENVAKIVMAAAAKHLTPVTLELGGKSPGIVDRGVDIEKVAAKIVDVKFLNCGQVCMTYDYLLTTPEIKPKLTKAITDAIQKSFGADVQKSPNYSRIVNQNHFDRVKSLVDKSKGKILFKGGEFDRDDVFVPPIVLDAEKDDPIMESEIFGPVLPIVTVNDLDEAINFVTDGEKPLAVYFFSENQANIKKVLDYTSSGAVGINDAMKHITVPELPFGGVGNSGTGRYIGKWGFDEFSHLKAVVESQL